MPHCLDGSTAVSDLYTYPGLELCPIIEVIRAGMMQCLNQSVPWDCHTGQWRHLDLSQRKARDPNQTTRCGEPVLFPKCGENEVFFLWVDSRLGIFITPRKPPLILVFRRRGCWLAPTVVSVTCERLLLVLGTQSDDPGQGRCAKAARERKWRKRKF